MSALVFFLLLNKNVRQMKINIFIILLLSLSVYSCSEDSKEVTETSEITEFIPNEGTTTSVLEDYPQGIISIDYNGQKEVVTRASAVTNANETLIISEFVDDATGEITKILIGVKGFTEGEFKGNVLGYNLLPAQYDLADITITEYGDIGEAISGSFSVEYEEGNDTISVSGDFSGLRLN